jgi:type II secretory pathway pseudopilin PulG
MSSLAVFLVLGGATALAAGGLGKNTVGAKQLKKNAVATSKLKNEAITTAKLKKGSVTGDKVALSSLGQVPSAVHADSATNADSATKAKNADTAANSEKLGGLVPSAFAPSSVIRSAEISATGVIVPGTGYGIEQSSVEHTSTGTYCIKNLDPAPTTAVATLRFGVEVGSTTYTEMLPGTCQLEVVTYNKSGTYTNTPFALILH